MERVTLQVPREMLQVGAELARAQDITLGQLVRNLLSEEISRARNARPPNRADERLVAPLRARLARDLAEAQSWDDLDARLARKDYQLVPAGAGLALHRRHSGARLCKASELGFSYAKLIERFRCGMPGHPHGWAEGKVLGRATTRSPKAPDTFTVIE
ncbi:hypothetical protein [Pseudaestuariivita sp.]|uniref:hypothetical protein n=1 Tax=Pseudaestuariivita sp. TaxID=2211669 RepID=UPI00405A4940